MFLEDKLDSNMGIHEVEYIHSGKWRKCWLQGFPDFPRIFSIDHYFFETIIKFQDYQVRDENLCRLLHQVCVNERYINSNGHVYRRLGCRDRKVS